MRAEVTLKHLFLVPYSLFILAWWSFYYTVTERFRALVVRRHRFEAFFGKPDARTVRQVSSELQPFPSGDQVSLIAEG